MDRSGSDSASRRTVRKGPWAWLGTALWAWRGTALWAWRGTLLCAGVALMSGVLAACGSVPVSTTGALSGDAARAPAAPPASASQTGGTEAVLCRHTATVSGLEIVRNRVNLVPVLEIAFPEQVGVASPARAQAVARALCALPVFPSGVFHCPALFYGTTYLLDFTANGRRLPAVTIEATGCEAVTGVGPARWAATSPGFWRALARAADLSPPGRSVFAGSGGLSCQPATSWREKINGCPAQIKPGSAAVP
jgi:hypothetical protein